jgi:hypothetical protein
VAGVGVLTPHINPTTEDTPNVVAPATNPPNGINEQYNFNFVYQQNIYAQFTSVTQSYYTYNPLQALNASTNIISQTNNTYLNFINGYNVVVPPPEVAIDVDNDVVRLPNRLTHAPEPIEAEWVAWVNESVEEADKRQRAREIYNEQQQRLARERALAEAERIAAEAKARALLFDFLNEEQQKSWVEHHVFFAEINNKRWKFTPGTHGNVYLMEGDEPVERFCIAPRAPHNGGFCPVDDVVLAQMLLISADEKEFRRIANITPLARLQRAA